MSESSVDKLKRLQAEVAEAWSSDTVHFEAGAKPRRLQRFLRFWALVAKGFWNNRCHVRAAALAYTTLLALVPLLAVSLSVASLVFDVTLLVVLALLLVFGCLLRAFWRLACHGNDVQRVIGAAGVAMVVGVVARNLTNDFFMRDMSLLFWSLSGMLLGLGNRLARNEERTNA